MRLKITRLAKYENLLLEADIIRVGNDLSQTTTGSSQDKQDAFDKIDKWLDDLIDKDIQRYLDTENFIGAFTAANVITAINEYLEYCRIRINRAKEKLDRAMSSIVPDPDYIKLLNLEVAKIADRIDLLNLIYLRAKDEKLAKTMNLIDSAKGDIVSFYYSPIKYKGSIIKQNLGLVKTAADESAKVEAASLIVQDIQVIEEITEEYPEEVKAGVEDAKQKAEDELEKEIGAEKLEDLKAGRKSNIFFTKIVKDILEYEQLYGTEAEIKETARLLRNVRIQQNENLDSDSKAYLIAWVNQIEAELLRKAQDKSIKLDMNKGIHYDFNIKLPLFQTVQLPVTGKQIADATFIAKAKKKALDLINAVFTPTRQSAAYYAAQDIGKGFATIYSIGLNKLAKTIGKSVKGREGEMKADAVSRLLMPTTDYLDSYLAKTKTNEEIGAPGTALNVPASISSMGPITPPTETTLGSGDNFQPKKKKKRIMEFSEFWQNKKL